MPYLDIVDAEGRSRRVDVAKAVVLGRGEECDVQVLEKKASRRHLRVSREAGGPWVVEDLDSSNGTFVGESRVLRHVLAEGTVVRVGDTRMTWHDDAPPALVGGKLALRPVGATPAPAAPRPAPAAAAREEGPEPEPVVETPTRPLDMRSFGRALALLVVAGLAVGGVAHFLGGKAGAAAEESRAKQELSDLLARADLTGGGSGDRAFESLANEWLARWPRSPDRPKLEAWLERARGRSAVRTGVEARFDTILARLGSLPEAQVRVDLLALRNELPDDSDLAKRVGLAFVELDRRRAAQEKADAERVREEAKALAAQGLPGEGLRRLVAWRTSRGLLAPEESARLKAAEDVAAQAVRTLADTTLAAARRETDPEKRRRLLQAAWPGVAGTFAQEDVADALRYASAPVPGTPGAPPGGPGTAPDPGAALLARAAEAEKLMGVRRWRDARAAFTALAKEPNTPALLKLEWTTRLSDVERVLALARALGEAAQEKGLARKIGGGTVAVTVTAADEEGLVWKRGETVVKNPWTDVEPEDLLPLLTPAKPTREQRLGVAVLAASVGNPQALVDALLPLYEPGPAGPDVDGLVARLLDGRSQAPEGGYRVHRGTLVDRERLEKQLAEERLQALEAKAAEILTKLAKEPIFKRLERMREARADLDKRRLQALLAIFNEKHYPYPYDRGRPPYVTVQKDVDRRVENVRALWESNENVRIPRTGPAGKLAEEALAAITELEKQGRNVTKLKAVLGQYEPYMTGETITLKDFWLNGAEKKFMAYNRWVMDVYNPAQVATITEHERKQVQITNEYRMMMGFTVTVVPGPAAYESIDEESVAKILDDGRIAPGSVVHLRAVRIDDRLVKSSRVHSLDMAARGYFDHFSQPNPATGAPRKSPFDRMRDAGYEGQGASENIAQAGGWKEAHLAWCHSSGHHRNLLSAWTDMGSGAAGGSLWTQNFGNGGGKPPVIEKPPEATTPRK